MRKQLLLGINFLFSFALFAQSDTAFVFPVDSQSVIYCNPKLIGMAPNKGLIISYYRVFNQTIHSNSKDASIGKATGTIPHSNSLEFRFKFPVFVRGRLKILLGVEYLYQEYLFDKEYLKFDLYNNLENRHLKSIGANITVFQSLNATHYFVGQIKTNLNGDYSTEELPNTAFLRVAVAALYGIKKCADKSYGFGLYYNYTFGRQFIIPAFSYNKSFTPKFGLEALLPASAKLRYSFTPKNIVYAGADIFGNSYNLLLKNPPLGNRKNVQLRESKIIAGFEYEREIYDFLWFGAKAGMLIPVNFNVVQKGDEAALISFKKGIHFFKSNPLIRNKLSVAPLLQLSLFLVPPRKLADKVLNTR